MASGGAPFDAEGMKEGCPQDRGDRKKYCCGRAGNKVFGHKEQAKREREGLGSSDFLPPQGNFSFVARRGSACMANGSAPFDAEGMKGGRRTGGIFLQKIFSYGAMRGIIWRAKQGGLVAGQRGRPAGAEENLFPHADIAPAPAFRQGDAGTQSGAPGGKGGAGREYPKKICIFPRFFCQTHKKTVYKKNKY